MRNRWIVLTIAVLLMACQAESSQATSVVVSTAIPPTPTPTPTPVVISSGKVAIDGSDTVYPLVQAVAEFYQNRHPGVELLINHSGTAGGFKKFCGIDQSPSIDIAMASRPITKAELDECNANSILYLKLLIAFDGVTIIVPRSNTFVDCLNMDQVKSLLTPRGLFADIVNWSDLNPDWPDTPISLWLPDQDSGTRVYLSDQLFGSSVADPSMALDLRGDVAGVGPLAQVVEGVAADPDAIGFVSYDLFATNHARLRPVAIQQEDGKCVPPTAITITGGQYATLRRPLYLYVNKARLSSHPAVRDFVLFSMGVDGFADAADHVAVGLLDQGIYDANMDLIIAIP